MTELIKYFENSTHKTPALLNTSASDAHPEEDTGIPSFEVSVRDVD